MTDNDFLFPFEELESNNSDSENLSVDGNFDKEKYSKSI